MKEKIIDYIEQLETKAYQSDAYFKERNELYINNQEKDKEIDRLKDLCNKYEEEHNTAFKLWTQKMEEMPDYEERMKLKKEVVRLNNIINELEKSVNDFDVFKEFTFPLMKRDEEQQVKSSIDYEWRKAIKEPFLDKLKELKEGNNKN